LFFIFCVCSTESFSFNDNECRFYRYSPIRSNVAPAPKEDGNDKVIYLFTLADEPHCTFNDYGYEMLVQTKYPWGSRILQDDNPETIYCVKAICMGSGNIAVSVYGG